MLNEIPSPAAFESMIIMLSKAAGLYDIGSYTLITCFLFIGLGAMKVVMIPIIRYCGIQCGLFLFLSPA